MVKILENTIKQDLSLPTNQMKAGAYAEFAFNVGEKGGMLPTSSLEAVVQNKFGGNGSDGDLIISSGTTTIDINSARILVKNYNSVSITGSASLAFSNPHSEGSIVFIRSKKNMTLTSSATPMIDCSGLGAAGGVGGQSTSAIDGNDATSGTGVIIQAGKGIKSTTGAVGTGGTITNTFSMNVFNFPVSQKYNQTFVGAGGGGASVSVVFNGNNHVAGSGGRGGGGLIIECAGKLNFATTNGISVAGANGSNASQDGGNGTVAGGGGGGSGGYCAIFYNQIGTSSGTINKSGGTGGNCVWVSSGTAYGAGGGGNPINAGSNGTSSSTNGAKTGGDGATGYSTIEQYIY